MLVLLREIGCCEPVVVVVEEEGTGVGIWEEEEGEGEKNLASSGGLKEDMFVMLDERAER